MTKQILNNLITDVNHESLVRFFRERNSTFRPIQESLSETYDNELFTNGTILGEIPFGLIDHLIVCAFNVTQALSERSGKKAQYDLAKKSSVIRAWMRASLCSSVKMALFGFHWCTPITWVPKSIIATSAVIPISSAQN